MLRSMENSSSLVAVAKFRPPHTETGLASRSIAGVAPKFPVGLQPSDVVARILRGVVEESGELAGADFV